MCETGWRRAGKVRGSALRRGSTGIGVDSPFMLITAVEPWPKDRAPSAGLNCRVNRPSPAARRAFAQRTLQERHCQILFLGASSSSWPLSGRYRYSARSRTCKEPRSGWRMRRRPVPKCPVSDRAFLAASVCPCGPRQSRFGCLRFPRGPQSQRCCRAGPEAFRLVFQVADLLLEILDLFAGVVNGLSTGLVALLGGFAISNFRRSA